MELLSRNRVRIAWTLFLGLIILSALIWYFFLPPSNFPTNTMVEIEEGSTVHEVAVAFKTQKLIRNPIVFDIYIRLAGEENKIKAGSYIFEKPLSVPKLARRVIEGQHNVPPLVITIPEGLSNEEIADLVATKVDDFDRQEFLEIAREYEGRLFPDTYHFDSQKAFNSKDLIETMRDNFYKKITPLLEEIENSSLDLDEVIILASIIEKEVYKDSDRFLVSSVLWNRLNIDMPLQVDAPFEKILGKNTYELTLEDLKVDSPYNTYLYKGLTPTAISNPGIDAIRAAINPAQSDYFFYVADREGNTYFSKTFTEHSRNVDKYF